MTDEESQAPIKRVLRPGETEERLTTNAYEDADLPGYDE
jgi:hypothetical protein